MLVYRIEDLGCWGPYKRSRWEYGHELIEDHSSFPSRESSHPLPFNDGLPWDDTDLRCAFPDLEALVQWMSGWLERLRAAGYVLSVYEVEQGHYRVGKLGKQCTFPTMHADLVARWPLPLEA